MSDYRAIELRFIARHLAKSAAYLRIATKLLKKAERKMDRFLKHRERI